MRTAIALVATLVFPSGSDAQEPFAERVVYPLRAGPFTHAGTGSTLVDSAVLEVPGATSLQVFFDEVDVPGGGRLEATGLHDGEVHVLTLDELEKWNYGTAFFNGDRVRLDLFAGAGERASYAVSHVLSGLAVGAPESICGDSDDRVPSHDSRTVRMLHQGGSVACSGWLGGPDDCVFGAGHCFTDYTASAQFNVPPSTPGGALQHPPVADQFPIDQDSRIWNDGPLGNDWGVCRLLPNSLNETAAAKYGYFELGFLTPDVGQTIRVTGFGSDEGSSNQTNQTHTGPCKGGQPGFTVLYQVDTTSGNSGSVIVLEHLGVAIGIHTNAGCGPTVGTKNGGTSLLHAELIEAWSEVCSKGDPAVPVASFEPSSLQAAVGETIAFQDTSTGLPNSWSWDFDGDGLEDSSSANAIHSYDEPGTYAVTLDVSNALGSDTLALPSAITVTPVEPRTPPYSQTFADDAPLGAEWVLTSSNVFGDIHLSDFGPPSPGSGHPALALASKPGGDGTHNRAVIHLDFSTLGAATLDYWARSAGDESDPADGVFLSDGVQSARIVSHANLAEEWTPYTVDLFEAAADAGMTLGAQATLEFGQFDNFGLGQDGILIDDVTLTTSPSLVSPPGLLFSSLGGTKALRLQAGVEGAGSPYLVLGSLGGSSPGIPLGSLELPLVADAYFHHTLHAPQSPPLVGASGVLDGTGQAVAEFVLPPGIVTVPTFVTHAYLLFDSVTQSIEAVSNPCELVILP